MRKVLVGCFAVFLGLSNQAALSQTPPLPSVTASDFNFKSPSVHLNKEITFQFQGGLIGDNIATTLSYLVEHKFAILYPIVTRPNTDPQAIISAALKKLPPDLLTEKLSALLCGWNVHVCKTSQATPAGVWSNSIIPTKEYDELLKTPAKDNFAETCRSGRPPPFVLCLPFATFADSIGLQAHEVASSKDVPFLVVNALQGCSVLDDACRKLIAFANPAVDPFDKKFSGKAIFPTRIVRMNIGLNPKVPQDSVFKALEAKYPPTGRWVTYTVPSAPGRLQAGPTNGAAGSDAASPEPSVVELPSNQNFLKAMGYTDEAKKLALELHKKGIPIVVGIFDSYGDPLHGAYASRPLVEKPKFDVAPSVFVMLDYARSQEFPHPPHKALPDIVEVYRNLKFPNPTARNYDEEIDHATMIAGIIGGRPSREPAHLGINPAARFWVYNTWRFSADANKPVDIDNILTHLPASEAPKAVVINFSQATADGRSNTRLADAMISDRGAALLVPVVAAAGNRRDKDWLDRRRTDPQQCWAFPACWSASSNETTGKAGILSVVALDASGKNLLRCRHVREAPFASPNWPGCDDASDHEPVTQWGPLFDVSAVGLAYGPMLHNTFSSLAGTSIATAYVSGLASLIYGMEGTAEYATSTFIANRIRVTADPDGFSKFGRVNFENALRFKMDVIYVTDSDKPLIGKIENRFAATFTLKTQEQVATTYSNVRPSDIARLQRVGRHGWRAILAAGTFDKLKLLPPVSVESQEELRIVTDTGPQTISIERVKDFIPCFKC